MCSQDMSVLSGRGAPALLQLGASTACANEVDSEPTLLACWICLI